MVDVEFKMLDRKTCHAYLVYLFLVDGSVRKYLSQGLYTPLEKTAAQTIKSRPATSMLHL